MTHTLPGSDGRRRAFVLSALFVLALALRLAVMAELAELSTFTYLVADARLFDTLAHETMATGWWPSTPFAVPPLYPYFLAIVYSVADASYAAVRVVQALIGAATVVLLALVAERAFGRTSSLATGLLAVFYGPLVMYASLLLKPTLTLFLLSTMVLALLEVTEASDRRREVAWALAAGLALGASVALRQNNLLLLPCLLAALVWIHRGRRVPVAALAALTLGSLLPLVVVGGANRSAGGRWLPTSLHGAVNFYIGNSEIASGTFVPLSRRSQGVDTQLDDARRLAVDLVASRGGATAPPAVLDDQQAASVLVGASLDFITHDTASWLRLMGRKTALFWNNYEIPDAEGYSLYREMSGWLMIAPVGFGITVVLALLGVVAGWSTRPAATAVLVFGTAAIFGSVTLFFNLARYRVPALAFLLPLAGAGVAALVDRWKARDRRHAITLLVVGAVAAAATFWPAFDDVERSDHRVALFFNLGGAASRWAGDVEAALGSPSPPPPGSPALAEGLLRGSEAIGFLGQALEINPLFAVAYVELAVAHHRRANLLVYAGKRHEAGADYDLAEAAARAALALPPEISPPELLEEVRALLVVIAQNRHRFAAGG